MEQDLWIDLQQALEIIWKLSDYSGDHEWIKEIREKYQHMDKQ